MRFFPKRHHPDPTKLQVALDEARQQIARQKEQIRMLQGDYVVTYLEEFLEKLKIERNTRRDSAER